jgi:vacuolar-type H+-ATPase catalytic subunit A/Vma1
MTKNLTKYQNHLWIIATLAAVSAISISVVAATSPPVTAVDEKTIQDTLGIVQEGPSPTEQPRILEEWKFTPLGNQPLTGKPQLIVTEMFAKPDQYNKIDLKSAPWLQNMMNKQGRYVDLPDQSKAQFFGHFNQMRNNMAYYEVTFEDGSTKYYHIDYHEEP